MIAETLHLAIQTLTEEQLRAIPPRFGAGLRFREVAQLIGKSEGASKQLQLRPLATLALEFALEGTYDAR